MELSEAQLDEQSAEIRISMQRVQGASSGASLQHHEPREGATKESSALILSVLANCALSPVLVGFWGHGEQTHPHFARVPAPRLGCGQKHVFSEQPGVCKTLHFG